MQKMGRGRTEMLEIVPVSILLVNLFWSLPLSRLTHLIGFGLKRGKDRGRGSPWSIISVSYSSWLMTCNTYFPPVFHVSSQIFFIKYHALWADNIFQMKNPPWAPDQGRCLWGYGHSVPSNRAVRGHGHRCLCTTHKRATVGRSQPSLPLEAADPDPRPKVKRVSCQITPQLEGIF